MLDIPVDIPLLSSSAIVITSASNSNLNHGSVDYSIGACQLIQNPPTPPASTNTMSPVLLVWSYLKNTEKLSPKQLTAEMYNAASFKMLEAPKYGKLVLEEGIQAAEYIPIDQNYIGNDRASIIVKFGNYNVKVTFFFKLMKDLPIGSHGYDPYEDKNNCPNGTVWKISYSAYVPDINYQSLPYSYKYSYSLQIPNQYLDIKEFPR